MFTALLAATQPTFSLEWRELGSCLDTPYPRQASPGAASGAGGSFAVAADAGAALGPGVSVEFRGDVGPYDAAVIKSTNPNDPKPLIDWLNENNYFVTPEGARLIGDYVREDKYFVAIKLLAAKGVSEIQPLVMRFTGPGPCVPIRLTSIAALDDLRINLWVLADNRVVPDNFYEMQINEARLDWFNNGSNYEKLVKEAADQAGGNAFIAEYAGPTSMLKGQLYDPTRYNLQAVSAAGDPPTALAAIVSTGLPRDSNMLNVLRVHIPLPDKLKAMGIDEITFYNRLGQFWATNKADFKPFPGGQALAADLDAKLIDPLRKAQNLFDNHKKLTRLATFISPGEMKVDPTFVMNPSLPDIPADRRAVAYRVCGEKQYNRCTAPVRLELKDGTGIWFAPKPQQYCYGGASDFERAKLDEMPALFKAYARSTDGEGLMRFDNQAMVMGAVGAHNMALVGSPSGGLPPGGIAPSIPVVNSQPGNGGCSSCSIGGLSAATSALAFPAAFAFLVLAARRRRRR